MNDHAARGARRSAAGGGRGRVRLDAAGGVEGASVLRPLPSCAGAGQGGSVSLLSAAAVSESVTVPAVPEQVRVARAF